MQSFELQVYKGGKWEFDSYFDDRETALFEATRLHEYNRYNGIRVLEEVFRDNSDTSDCSVIFSRLRKIENKGGGVGDPRTQASREAHRKTVREGSKSGQEQKGGSRKSSKTKSSKTKSRKTGKAGSAAKSRRSSGSKSNASLKMLLIMAVVILVVGVGAMVGLRFMADLM